ncbi:MAG: Gfo/Idh/MocA family oxidoreductase [Sedimentisphaerales bacterium]
MEKVSWGILSTAKIGIEKVIPAMQNGEFCNVTAIASRDYDRAKNMASKLKIPRAYGSYEDLLEDSEVQAVYIPLPNHMHVEWSIKSLEADKHVLCEKPIGISVVEAQELLTASKEYPNLKIMEAFMYRFHPQWQKTKQLVTEGRIGDIKTIQSFFCFYNTDPDNIRNKPELGGGGMMDIGCYCISHSRFIYDAEPERVVGIVEYDQNFKVDILASGILDFGKRTSTFTCSMQLNPYQRVNIFGTKGRIEIEIPFNAPPDMPCRIFLQEAGNIKEIVFPICDQYTIECDLFSQAVLNDTDVPTPLEDALANMKVIEGIIESSKSGTWSKIE